MVGLPRSIIKKYGVSKKAWAVFRGSNSSRTSSKRRKARRGGSMARRKSYRRGSSGGFGLGGMGSLVKQGAIGGIAGYGAGMFGFKNPMLAGIGGLLLTKSIVGGAAAYLGNGMSGGMGGSVGSPGTTI